MEQCQDDDTAYITHYVILLDFLINTPKDVALLRSKGIIDNYLGSDEAVAQLFNKLPTNVIADVVDSPYYEHLNNMDAFYNKRWNKWKGNLKRIYFQNPWTIISLNAAIVLLICTITQTVCSILSLKK
ncbi:putative transmembrane protein [Thalictrum thalictroides]|uniref:Putative transmembrane protein n=1 Tax=Thalictrum thalictroides TaxID=46969 RepID=A0A7J6VNW8_THATH|nr:putative transmembrane protein [Thalictrum thalictroides]